MYLQQKKNEAMQQEIENKKKIEDFERMKMFLEQQNKQNQQNQAKPYPVNPYSNQTQNNPTNDARMNNIKSQLDQMKVRVENINTNTNNNMKNYDKPASNVKKRNIPGVTIDTSDKSENNISETTKSENSKTENSGNSETSNNTSNTNSSTNISKLRTKQKESINSKNNSTFSKRKYKRPVISVIT